MDFVFRIAILSVAYFYPAYKCFKLIDCGKPKSEELHVWCQYWIIIAMFTGFERIADTFISWLPFYSGAKLAFVVYLWHPDTKGTEYVYQTFLRPLVSNNMESMEFNFGLLRDEAAKVLKILWTKLMVQLQARASEILHQNVVERPSKASQHAQGNIPLHPSISASFYWSNLPQQRQPLHLGQQTLVTQSAIWPNEIYKKGYHGASHPLRPSIPLSVEQQKQSRPALDQHTLASQRGLEVQDLRVIETASGPSRTVARKDNGPDKEETDFELVHFSEVPKHESTEATICNISAQGARSRWRW